MLATLNYHQEAIEQGLKALRLSGINLPSSPNLLHVLIAILKIEYRLGLRKPQTFNLEPVSNDKYRAIIDLISQLLNSAFIINQNLFLFFIERIVLFTITTKQIKGLYPLCLSIHTKNCRGNLKYWQ